MISCAEYIFKKVRFFSISLWDIQRIRIKERSQAYSSWKWFWSETIRCTGVKERTLWKIARSACVVTGVAPLSLRGWNGDSWNNGGSAYCRIPRGEPPLVAAPPRLVVTPRDSCARTCRSIYPLSFSWLDAFVVQRRSSRYLGQLSERRRDADDANFAGLSSTLSSARPTG